MKDYTKEADELLDRLAVTGRDGEPPNEFVRRYVKGLLGDAYLQGRLDGMEELRDAIKAQGGEPC